MIYEKLDVDTLALIEIIRHPLWFGEFLKELEPQRGEEDIWEYTEYQREILCDFNNYVNLTCARAVGKCLHKDAKILNTNTGEYSSVEHWFNNQKNLSISAIDFSTFKRVTDKPIIRDNGLQPIVEINAQKGYKTKVTYEHPFLTNLGWKNASDLKVGDFIAVPNKLNYFGRSTNFTENEISIIAHFIAEGTYNIGSITTEEPEVIKDIYEYANEINHKVRVDGNQYHITLGYTGKRRNRLYIRMLDKLGLRKCHSTNKFIPKIIFKEPKNKLSLFLNKLFGDDGWCSLNKDGSYEIGYGTSSEILARDIKHLLLRFGIVSTLNFHKNSFTNSWNISIKGKENCEIFYKEIGFTIKRKQENLAKIINKNFSNNPSEIIPIPNYDKYFKIQNDSKYPRKLLYYPTKSTINNIINKDDLLLKFKDADIYWVKVVSIKFSDFPEQTYSVECPKYHTLVADDIYSHNTVTIEDKIQWLSVNKFSEESVLALFPNRVHLAPVFLKLSRRYRFHPFLKWWAHNNSINSSNFTLSLINGFFLDCRIAGSSNSEAPVAGMHVKFAFVDESAFIPFGTFMGMQPCMNTWMPGFQLFVAGTPDGRREKSVNFYCDQIDPTYSKHRVTAHDNPRWTDDDEQNAINRYGGVESEGYVHAVLGQHGSPVYSMFDRNFMKIENYEVYTDKRKGREFSDDSQFIYTYLSSLPQLPAYYDAIIFGVDLGYTEPTVITVLYRLKDKFYFHSRLTLSQVDYPIQEQIIDLLDTKYKPVALGIDAGAGGSGKSVIQHLTLDDKYLSKNYKHKLVPVEFGGKTSIGYDDAGEEVFINTKQFAMQKLQSIVNNKDLVFSQQDDEMISELERTRYTKTEAGNIKYSVETFSGKESKGDDHATASLVCGLLAWHSKFEASNYLPEVKIMKSFQWW